jgi:hypothetical protein
VARELADTADILRRVGHADGHLDPRRGDVGLTLAALVDTCAGRHPSLPYEVVAQALRVAGAVDRAPGQRRFP